MERHTMFTGQEMARMSLFKLMHSIDTILIQILADLFVEVDKLILKFSQKYKQLRINTTLKHNKLGGLVLPDFKTYIKVQLTRQCGAGTKTDKQINATERNTHIYGQLIFNKDAKTIQ